MKSLMITDVGVRTSLEGWAIFHKTIIFAQSFLLRISMILSTVFESFTVSWKTFPVPAVRVIMAVTCDLSGTLNSSFRSSVRFQISAGGSTLACGGQGLWHILHRFGHFNRYALTSSKSTWKAENNQLFSIFEVLFYSATAKTWVLSCYPNISWKDL